MRRLLNEGWEFALLPLGSGLEQACQAAWQAVDIPHDWLIWDADHLYENGDGWYRRTLAVPEAEEGKYWSLRFDGVYMDCDVLLDGQVIRTHRYGYTPFDAELKNLTPGAHELMVHVRCQSPNSRWYSGAGIYRDVILSVLPERHLVPDSLYVHAEPEGDSLTGSWRVEVEAEIVGGAGNAEPAFLTLTDADGAEAASGAMDERGDKLTAVLHIPAGRLWDCRSPHLYSLSLTLAGETYTSRIGLRTTAFDPDRGFLLNGERIKLHGVCLHHDLGALGSAFNPVAFRRQIRLMKDMGVNALRTSHNPPAARAMDILDEEGILVIDEAFDMWERPKTTYDYARFFPDCWAEDIAAMVRRDRNHPCVILWSVGNEIYDTFASPRGEEVTVMLRDGVRLHDPKANARVTIGSNYMPWEGAQRCAEQLKIAGYNYAEKFYEIHHREHPDWVIYGSETASALSSRGVCHFPRSANILSDEDLQCSDLGNSISAWGTPDMRRCLNDEEQNPFSMGQFLWSGIDYIGEPTPYHTRSCYFGMADTAGFPKNYWHQARACWNPAPSLHLGVCWDWNEGQLIDVPVYTNLAEAELLVDEVSCGKQTVTDQLALWQVPFHGRTLTARAWGTDAAGQAIALEESARRPGSSSKLAVKADRSVILADGEDMAFLTVWAEDEEGNPVPNAADRVTVTVSGQARLMGVDNGDPSDEDGYKVNVRRLFNGLLLVMIGALDQPGEALVTVSAPGLTPASVSLTLTAADIRPGTGRAFTPRIPEKTGAETIAVRRIDLLAEGDTHLTPDRPAVRIRTRILPENASFRDVSYRVCNAAGITVNAVAVQGEGDEVIVTGLGDGQYYLRAACRNGSAHTRVISQLEITVSGFGKANLDPYGFITGGLHDVDDGGIGAGNEQGIAFSREGFSMVGFSYVDFGAVGSDEITVPIFALNDERYDLTLWDGDPREGGRRIAVLPYQKPSIWNVYQEETWKLPERLTGLHTICFSIDRKIHMKGFRFTRQSRAFVGQRALDADETYGDSFIRTGEGVTGIGNNVSLIFREMDFGDGGEVTLMIDGATPLETNAVNVRITDAAGETSTQMCPFQGQRRGEQRFGLSVPAGVCSVAFVFLPGSQFDFYRFRFERREGET